MNNNIHYAHFKFVLCSSSIKFDFYEVTLGFTLSPICALDETNTAIK